MTRGSSSKFLRISEPGPLDEMGKKRRGAPFFFFFAPVIRTVSGRHVRVSFLKIEKKKRKQVCPLHLLSLYLSIYIYLHLCFFTFFFSYNLYRLYVYPVSFAFSHRCTSGENFFF